ncbi:MgtC/SapB family protein [Granulicella sp. 5B5]|uniref:MgtC/SapB family protein n=1 Tax=Granulicella sp. 5B5 TaxID=1617967 RepID=UPI0015F3F7E0|nr:MgtC/SapB family protein [Granulicella sp. 5B5]QMV17666.1 MgtC/SapB family protein [Granulicella sp. 5B5]
MADQAHIQMATDVLLSGSSVKRLLMSCAMGGAVGIEREWRQKDSGLRTNMLICMGAALFTIMSEVLAGDSTPNKGQVAANIVQGVGFLGAGLILHSKVRVFGLTSAATVFVVAAIGMTCGAGLYLVSLAATALVLIALQLVGLFEMKLAWKRYPMIYEVRANVGPVLPMKVVDQDRAEAMAEDVAAALHRMQRAILHALDSAGQRLSVLERDNVAGIERVAFTVMATMKTHNRLLAELRASDATDQVVAFKDAEEE